jgi:HAD superfamily hydrolase (TIGR01509 family)
MPYQAAIFDIDGTLIDTNEAHVESWREAFIEQGHEVSLERIRPQIGKGGDQLVPAILGNGVNEAASKQLAKGHDEAFFRAAQRQQFRVFPEIGELFNALRRRGMRIALATSSQMTAVQTIETSARFALRSLADIIVTADDAEATKPNPDLVFAALKKLGLPPARAFFVGDTAHDGEAARSAGVPFVGLLCGGCSSDQALREAGAQSVWQDPMDLLRHLEEALGNEVLPPSEVA